MRVSDIVWEVLDTGLYLAHVIAVILVGIAACACPIWLGMIHKELVAIREQSRPCDCRHDDGPGPVLPRVLPRLRRIGEDAD